jgi:hypothetical protein
MAEEPREGNNSDLLECICEMTDSEFLESSINADSRSVSGGSKHKFYLRRNHVHNNQ